MKNQIYIILALIFFYSCNDSKNKKETLGESFKTAQLKSEQEKLNLEIYSDSILNKWVEYYRDRKPSFSLTNFKLETTDSLKIINGNVFGSFDKEFDIIYKDFLIYNSAKNQYLDFDSYSWTIDENGEFYFSPDQEISLVDIENKAVNRIAFRGTSQWVEDAYWKNDSTIVLLENDSEKKPIITVINLKKELIQNFKYNDTLDFETDYTTERFKQKGIITK